VLALVSAPDKIIFKGELADLGVQLLQVPRGGDADSAPNTLAARSSNGLLTLSQ
jgi:hypothetical protein